MGRVNFQVEPGLPDHAKVRRLGNDKLAAIGLWTLCGAWSASNSTNGFVPEEIVTRYAVTRDASRYLADLLVKVNLWVEKEIGGETGYVFHDWSDTNLTSMKLTKQRDDTARRNRAYRARKRAAQQHDQEEDRDASRERHDDEPVTRHVTQLQPSPPPSPPHTPPLPTPPTGGLGANHPEQVALVGEGVPGGDAPRKRSATPPAKGSRLPDEWEPTEKLKQWVRDNCNDLTDRQKRYETEQFKRHWWTATGKNATKVKWDIAYQKWMAKANEDQPAGGASHPGRAGLASPPPRRSTADDRVAGLDRFLGQGPARPQHTPRQLGS